MLVQGVQEKSSFIRFSPTTNVLTRDDPITIFLTLKTGGGIYDHRYVNATARNIRQNVTHPHEIVCITNDSSGITEVDRVVKMQHNWYKWWGKLEAFKPDVTTNKHAMMIDLDTVCLGNIDFLCRATDGFYGLRDFYNLEVFQTGLLKWTINDDTVAIYEKFVKTDFSKYKDKGDHEWVGLEAKDKKFIQDAFPGEVCSYKKHLAHIHKKFMDPSIVCFHGDPRPHTVKDHFIKAVWKY